MIFSDIETRVLRRIQQDFPLVEGPFARIASELDIPESELLETIRRLKERRTVRTIAGIFEPQSLGYSTVLVAMKIDRKKIDSAKSAINGHPGVSHNYLRDHEYNLWFTIAEESEEAIEKAIDSIAHEAHTNDYLLFKNETMYKIGLKLRIGNGDTNSDKQVTKTPPPCRTFSKQEKNAILLLEQDLPLESNSFEILLKNHNSRITLDFLLKFGSELKEKGYMRRYSALIRPALAGYAANAMIVWRPENPAMIEPVAHLFCKEHNITHIYRRTVYPGTWDYPLFTMVHATDNDKLVTIVNRLSKEAGISDYKILHTLQELKKEKVIYFSPKFSLWKEGR